MAHKEQHDDLIDLGTASVETLGAPIGVGDEQNGQAAAGLSHD